MDIEGIENLQEEGATKDSQPAPPIDGGPETWDPTPTGPTTSPDVVITNDPGPAPEGDAPDDDGSVTETDTVDDPASDDQVIPINVFADDADA